MSKLSPCKDCQERYPACHGHCDKYATWKSELISEKIAKGKAMRDASPSPWTDAKKKAVWNSKRRDYSGAYKKFSS